MATITGRFLPSLIEASPTASHSRPLAPSDRTANPGAQSRALVPVTPSPRPHAGAMARPRPSAPFLAQLIATAQQAPQTRGRRRAEPADACAAYAAASTAVVPAPTRYGSL
jgi:hypothetical protein